MFFKDLASLCEGLSHTLEVEEFGRHLATENVALLCCTCHWMTALGVNDEAVYEQGLGSPRGEFCNS